MTVLKIKIRKYLLSKGLVEYSDSSGNCYSYSYSEGEWQGWHKAKVTFPMYDEHTDRIIIKTWYAGACTGDEGYVIAKYDGFPLDFDEFLKILDITRFNGQIEKGKNQYVYINHLSDYYKNNKNI